MQFLAPLMLVGVLGIAIPVWIHLRGNRRAPVVRFAAMDFLLATRRRLHRRFRLREWLLLLARCIAVLAVALILAQPYSQCATDAPAVASGPQAVVIVLDNSLPSFYQSGGRTAFERGREAARGILQQVSSTADVALVTTVRDRVESAGLTRDSAGLARKLEELAPSPQPPDLDAAIARAEQLVAASHHQQKSVYVLSTLTQASKPARGFTVRQANDVVLVLVPLLQDLQTKNLAIRAASATLQDATSGRLVRVACEVANTGTVPSENRLSLRVGDTIYAQIQVSVPPQTAVTKHFEALLPAATKQLGIVVELDDDALLADNRYFVRGDFSDRVAVLAINGDPRADTRADELFYLLAALQPRGVADGEFAVATMSAEELDRRPQVDADVLLLANVRSLEPTTVAVIAKWVRGGGALLITTGEHVASGGYASLAELLPFAIHEVQVAQPAIAIEPIERSHGALGGLGPVVDAFSGVRIRSFHVVRTHAGSDDARVVMQFAGGFPALMERSLGRGRSMLYASTIDQDWSNLPLQPVFLPFVRALMRYLAGTNSSVQQPALLVGDFVTLPDGARHVHTPSGEVIDVGDAGAFAGTSAPGLYKITRQDDANASAMPFVVNVDSNAADLRPLSQAELPPTRVTANQGFTGEGSHTRRVELWHALAMALLLLLALEGLLAWR